MCARCMHAQTGPISILLASEVKHSTQRQHWHTFVSGLKASTCVQDDASPWKGRLSCLEAEQGSEGAADDTRLGTVLSHILTLQALLADLSEPLKATPMLKVRIC